MYIFTVVLEKLR